MNGFAVYNAVAGVSGLLGVGVPADALTSQVLAQAHLRSALSGKRVEVAMSQNFRERRKGKAVFMWFAVLSWLCCVCAAASHTTGLAVVLGALPGCAFIACAVVEPVLWARMLRWQRPAPPPITQQAD